MDAFTVRIILLVLGILLVIGIYLFDRYRRMPKGFSLATKKNKKPNRQQPIFIDDLKAPDDQESLDNDYRIPEFIKQDGVSVDTEVISDSTLSTHFSAHGESDYLHTDPAIMDDLPQLVLQISLRSKRDNFTGHQIDDALKQVGMQFGVMDLYHCYAGEYQERTLFSAASMVEPGNFPAAKMDELETPGILLFTQLPGVIDGLAIYADMIFTAERLVSILNADLLDEGHNILTKQAMAHTRDKILQHQQKVRLARRR